MWVKPLLTLLRDTLWDKGHTGDNAMIVGCNIMAEWGHWVPMVCAGSLQCLQGALGLSGVNIFPAPWVLRS